MRTINDEGINLVKSFEGKSLKIYRCVGGVISVGYGSTRGWDGRPLRMDMEPITDSEAEDLLRRDLKLSERWVSKLIKTEISDNAFSSLVSFTFNVGAGALQRSTLRMKLNRGEIEGAANEFPKWKFANGRAYAGLLRRRYSEQKLFLKP